MALIDLLKKTTAGLSFQGAKPKSYDGQVSQLKKDFAKESQLDLDGKDPAKYSDNLPK